MKYLLSILLILGTGLIPGYAQVYNPSMIQQAEAAAMEAIQQERWGEAIDHFTDLSRNNPYNAYYHHYLAVSHEQVGHHEAAKEHAVSAWETGYRRGPNAYLAGRFHLRRMQLDSALTWFERAIPEDVSLLKELAELEGWERLADRFRNRPLVQVVESIRTPAQDRRGRWMQDLTVFRHAMEWAHFHPFNSLAKEDWERSLRELETHIPQLEDHEVIASLLELTVKIGDGHTILVPPYEGPGRFHRFPIVMYLFADGLYVQAAAPRYRELVGRKIIGVGNRTAEELFPLVARVFPHDNDMGVKWGHSIVLQIPELLHALGISDYEDEVTLRYLTSSGAIEEATLNNPEPLTGDILADMLYDNLGEGDWVHMNPQDESLPLWRRQLHTFYRVEALQEERALYFAFNQIRNGDMPFDAFLDTLFDVADSTDARYLIIDLRTNEGGDLTMTRPLLKRLIAHPHFSREGHLFVLTGRETFSAAGYFAANLETYLHPIFVGEPTGTRPNFIGESGGVFQLPNSGLWVNGSNLFWQGSYSFDKRRWIEPDVLIELTSDDFAANRDPVLQAVLNWIGDH